MQTRQLQYILFGITLICLFVYTSTRPIATEKYVTWDVPYFAGINNQLIMMLSAAVFRPFQRRVVVPSFNFIARHGLNCSHSMPPTEMFAKEGLEAAGYVTDIDFETTEKQDQTRVHFRGQDAQSKIAVIIFDAKEYFWRATAQAFVIWNFAVPWLRGGPYRVIASHLRAADLLERCTLEAAPDIKTSVAVHIRTWSSDFNFENKTADEQCREQSFPFLNLWYGDCGWTPDYLYDNVIRVQRNDRQSVYIATDDASHSLINGLMQKLNGRGKLIKMGEQCKAEIKQRWPNQEDHEWRHKVYPDLIESSVLVMADTFLGSFFSTYSQVAAVRSIALGHRAYFMQTKTQRVLWDNRGEITLIALVLILGALVRWIRSSRTRSYAAVLYVRLLRLGRPDYCLRNSTDYSEDEKTMEV